MKEWFNERVLRNRVVDKEFMNWYIYHSMNLKLYWNYTCLQLWWLPTPYLFITDSYFPRLDSTLWEVVSFFKSKGRIMTEQKTKKSRSEMSNVKKTSSYYIYDLNFLLSQEYFSSWNSDNLDLFIWYNISHL